MKTTPHHRLHRLTLTAGSALSLSLFIAGGPASALAAPPREATSSTSSHATAAAEGNRSRPGTSQADRQQSHDRKTDPRAGDQRQAGMSSNGSQQVRITRASNYLGSDVYDSQDRKVGDIVDFYFDTSSAPHLAYVVVMTGGFLDMGGDVRAVPAEALTMENDMCRLDISRDQFWDAPVLPEDRDRFLERTENTDRIARVFNLGDQRQGRRSQQSTDTASTNSRQQRSTGDLVSFGELRQADIYSRDDDRLGYCVDAWINLDHDRAPYVEISPTFQPFRSDYDLRYAIPLAKFERTRGEFSGYTFAVNAADLREADSITETEGLQMLDSGEIGETVLRVRLAQQ